MLHTFRQLTLKHHLDLSPALCDAYFHSFSTHQYYIRSVLLVGELSVPASKVWDDYFPLAKIFGLNDSSSDLMHLYSFDNEAVSLAPSDWDLIIWQDFMPFQSQYEPLFSKLKSEGSMTFETLDSETLSWLTSLQKKAFVLKNESLHLKAMHWFEDGVFLFKS